MADINASRDTAVNVTKSLDMNQGIDGSVRQSDSVLKSQQLERTGLSAGEASAGQGSLGQIMGSEEVIH